MNKACIRISCQASRFCLQSITFGYQRLAFVFQPGGIARFCCSAAKVLRSTVRSFARAFSPSPPVSCMARCHTFSTERGDHGKTASCASQWRNGGGRRSKAAILQPPRALRFSDDRRFEDRRGFTPCIPYAALRQCGNGSFRSAQSAGCIPSCSTKAASSAVVIAALSICAPMNTSS